MKYLRCIDAEGCNLHENEVYLCRESVNPLSYCVYEVDSNQWMGRLRKDRFQSLDKWRDVYWETAGGNKIKIRNLGDDHLRNIRNMLVRWSYYKNIGLSSNKERIVDVYKPIIEKEYNFRNQDYTTKIAQNYEI